VIFVNLIILISATFIKLSCTVQGTIFWLAVLQILTILQKQILIKIIVNTNY